MTAREALLYLMRLGMKRQAPGGKIDGDFRWEEVLKLAAEQGLTAIVADGVSAGDVPVTDPGATRKLLAGVVSYEKRHREWKSAIGELGRWCQACGFSLMVLKGYGLSLNYPEPSHRPSGDIDIWLFGRWKEANARISKDLGIKIDNSGHHHSVFYIRGQMVENHYDFVVVHSHPSNRLIEKRLKQLAPVGCEEIQVEGAPVYLPSPAFNALFLLRHMASHFAREKILLRHLLDWGTFAEKYRGQFRWEEVISFSKKLNMNKFFHCINALCVDALGFEAAAFPALERDPALEQRVLGDILAPEFAEKPPKSFVRILLWKYRRWRANAWKNRMVYSESMTRTFFVQIWSHLLKPASFRTT